MIPASVSSGGAKDVPTDDGTGTQVPTDFVETSSKRHAEEAGSRAR